MTVPPPTPNRPLKAPAAVAIAASRTAATTSRGILRPVAGPLAPLAPLTADPVTGRRPVRHRRHARPDRAPRRGARVPQATSRLLGGWRAPLRLVACISGRSAAEARRLVGVGAIAYAGSHGAELLEPGAAGPRTDPAFAELGGPREALRRRARHPELRRLRVRIEDKGRSRAALARRARRGRRAPARGLAPRPRPPGSPPTGGARCSRCARRCRSTRARRCATGRAAGRARGAVRRRRRHRPRRLRRARRAGRRGRARRRGARGRGSDEGRPRSSSGPTSSSTASRASPRVLAALAEA